MMWEELALWVPVVLLGLIAVQVVRFLLADGDLRLMSASLCGKRPGSLSGKVVWITGASGGIGEALAYQLARVGCQLVLTARRQAQLDRVKDKCKKLGYLMDYDVYAFSLDMRDVHSHREAVEKVIARFQRIDILINNAGRSQRGYVQDTALEVDREIFDLNFLGALSLTKAVLPYMVKRRMGHLVVNSSLAGKIGAPFSAAYSATKFALHGWFEAARVELAGYNIAVTTICPGPVESRVNVDALSSHLNVPIPADLLTREKKMPTERCARLMAVAIANKLHEVWISQHPVLATAYLTQYLPDVARYIATFIGKRPALLKKIREGAV